MTLSHEEMSRKGGKATSAKKARAAAKNWQKAQAALAAKRASQFHQRLISRGFKLQELLKAAREDETLSPIRQRQLIGP